MLDVPRAVRRARVVGVGIVMTRYEAHQNRVHAVNVEQNDWQAASEVIRTWVNGGAVDMARLRAELDYWSHWARTNTFALLEPAPQPASEATR